MMFGGMPSGADEDMPVFVISVAAQLSGLHAQTLRSYDRLGLVLREVQRLSQEDGVNLAGIKRIIELENQVDALKSRLAELTEELAATYAAAEQATAAIHASYRKDLVPIRQQTALVVWKPKRR
jgi:MerR family transcriptional regulator/heat shock protein HspR